MAITDAQRELCRLIARRRAEAGESYVAGGVALNTLLQAPRLSRDIDLFHDTQEALVASFDADRALLLANGYSLDVRRERPTFVEAVAGKGGAALLLQWVCDSAYRFFPLVEHDDFGLVLHPFDLATNKVLALVGRLEPRDWVDTIEAAERLQPLGYLAWAACGKDPGYGPAAILESGARHHYSDAELSELEFEGDAPSAADLSSRWHALLVEAEGVIERLPPDEVGCCVLDASSRLLRASGADLDEALAVGEVRFHRGTIGGVYPTVRDAGEPRS